MSLFVAVSVITLLSVFLSEVLIGGGRLGRNLKRSPSFVPFGRLICLHLVGDSIFIEHGS